MEGGFVISKGKIATAHHLIKDMAIGSTVRLVREETEYAIENILAIDNAHDLAIIQAQTSAQSLQLGDSDTIQIADSIYVAGKS